MAAPILHSVAPHTGPSSGGDLVRLVGLDFSPQVAVRFDLIPAEVVVVRSEGGFCVADVRTPAHPEALVSVVVENLDDDGLPVAGETATLLNAYRFTRAVLVAEASITRLVRALLQMLKSQVVENTTMSVTLDYDDTPDNALRVVPVAKLPALVLSGPTVRPSRFYATNVPHEDLVAGILGPEFRRRRPAYTVDLAFVLTAASDRTVELLNLMASVATFLNHNRWLEVPRDPASPERGKVRWEMDPEGDFRTSLRGQDDIRAFTCGFVVRGFDIDEGLPLDLSRAVIEVDAEFSSVANIPNQ